MREQLREAFLSGFFVSRQGYNGEYAAEHLAPDSASRISSCDMPELETLADQYIDLVYSEGAGADNRTERETGRVKENNR
jgi:hypothetical protein